MYNYNIWGQKENLEICIISAETLNGCTTAIAKAFAESEFEQYRVLQDKNYESDFDRLIAESSDKKFDE